MKKTISTFTLIGATSVLMAQSIDFNNKGSRLDQCLEHGYEVWEFGREISATKKFATDQEGDSIQITISSVPGLQGNAVRTNWWKTGVVSNGYRLVGDMAINITLNSDGNDVAITSGSSGLQLSIEGLALGEHTLMAYHSNTDGLSKDPAPLDVVVNGQTVATGVVQRVRGVTPATTPFSYIHFTVTDATKPTVIQYITMPKAGVEYGSTAVALNALQFDRPNPLTMAHDPQPANQDLHADGDAGSIALRWSPSKLAVKHHVLIGTDKNQLSEVAVKTNVKDTTYVLDNLYSMNTYYWRIDEEDAQGQIHHGESWTFKPRQLAFPGAEGYGRFAQGGRGGVVYHVTNLNHDHNPGSLLYGLTDLEGPRTIVFDVSGIIEWDFGSVFTDPYVTIAAQTAPGKGICLKYCNLNIGRDDICRFLRAKRGYGETGNALGVSGGDHTMVDHTTCAWGTDETVSGRGAKNISFQYCMIAEALGIADHKNYSSGTNHGYAATIDGRVGSWHHNLLVNCYGRNWSMGGGMDGNNKAIGQMDIFNNVVYNWGTRTTDGGCHECHFVHNYPKMGPDTKEKYLFTQEYENVGDPSSTWQAYVHGNIRDNKDGSLTNDAEGVTYRYVLKNGAKKPSYQTFVSESFFPSYATIHTAKDAYKVVTSYAGAYMPCQDDQHKRVVRETLNRTYTYVGSRSHIKGEIDHEDDCGGFEEYPVEHRAADFDTDQDGIPNWFEAIVGTDPQVANNNADPDRDGWTQLEDYLDFMSHPYSILKGGETKQVDVAQYFAGFTKSPVFSVSVADGADFTASISGSKLNLQAGSNSGVFSLQLTVVDGDGSTFTRRYNVAVAGAGTGIESLVNDQETTTPAFDLSGRQTTQRRGLYIQQGRVVMGR